MSALDFRGDGQKVSVKYAHTDTHLVPPPQAHEDAARHVLDSPEVKREEQNNEHKVQHKVVADKEAQQICDQGSHAEAHEEKHSHRMPANE